MIKIISLLLILAMITGVNAADLHAEADASGGDEVITSSYSNSGLLGGYVDAVANSISNGAGYVVTLLSEAYAYGTYSGGYGEVLSNGESSTDYTNIEQGTTEAGQSYTRVTTHYTTDGSANAIAWAWASNEEPAWSDPIQPLIIPKKPDDFGFFEIYGKSDAERYYYLKNMRDTNCNGVDYTNITILNESMFDSYDKFYLCSLSLYRLDIKLKKYGLTAEEFENKYPLVGVIKSNPNFIKNSTTNTT